MIKTMQARYAGRDAITGASIRPGDEIQYCTDTRRAWLSEPGDMAATLMLAVLMLAGLLAGALHYFDVLMP